MPAYCRYGVAALVVLVGACAAAAAVTAQDAGAPQEQRVFRAGTTLVPLDVRVIDREGRPVTDLEASDFTLLEDKVPQAIAHFAKQALVPEPSAVPTGPVARAADSLEFTSSRARTFLIVLGRGRLQPPSKGVDAMLHLVQARLLPQDRVAVLAWNRATDFAANRDTIRQVLERFRDAHENLEMRIVLWERSLQSYLSPGKLPEDIQRDIDTVFGGPRSAGALDDDLDAYLDQETAAFHDVTMLYLGVEYLRHLAGEKHLVYVSEFGVGLRGADGDRHLGRRAADARVVLDVIHAGGVPFGFSNGLSGHPPGLGMPQAMTGRAISGLTGGSFFHHKFSNSSMDVDAIDAATRFGYLLGYYPTNGNWNGKYRQVAVRVNRPNVRVLHRDGYLGRREIGALDSRSLRATSRMMTAAAASRPITDLRVTANHAVVRMTGTTGQVEMDVRIDLDRVEFGRVDGRHHASIDIAVFLDGRSDDASGELRHTIELNVTDERLEELRESGVTHTVTVPVTSPPDRAKVVVYDYASDLLGTHVATITRVR
jgi:VWFA-related protein